MAKKDITVIMPVYNTPASYLTDAIEIILQQNIADKVLLTIVNDGSNRPDTLEVLDKYKDKINLINLESNQGNIVAMNVGLESEDTPYIARMDSDDFCSKNRLQAQLQYYQANEVDILSCSSLFINEKSYIIEGPSGQSADNDQIKSAMWFYNPLAHGSIFMSKAILDNNQLRYQEAHYKCEDWGLYLQAFIKELKFHKISKAVYYVRQHSGQLTRQRRVNEDKKIIAGFIEISRPVFTHFHINNVELWAKFISGRMVITANELLNETFQDILVAVNKIPEIDIEHMIWTYEFMNQKNQKGG